MAAAAETLLGHHAGPDVEALLAVAEELQLLAALQLLAVVGEDEEGVGRHRVQGHVLCTQEVTTRSTRNLLARSAHVTRGPRPPRRGRRQTHPCRLAPSCVLETAEVGETGRGGGAGRGRRLTCHLLVLLHICRETGNSHALALTRPLPPPITDLSETTGSASDWRYSPSG